ncbi:MAG: peptidylprolyl isomerase [Bacteroidales bacterium]|nr:peptidylprolyl isomerase [Bacteroidales bacterium]MDD2812801.1 peptidylprolyl isomerase [Bacteroidales bacterium]MDD3385768.1 peptidylprolyl isomerase [Bacteroidales bacterium]MDD3811751.1 peptidylprolyl isomerase [Bacteroidales bacterium]MDD3871467.1 peptidylprolyl isomerase [Bacteroidales bacterium]
MKKTIFLVLTLVIFSMMSENQAQQTQVRMKTSLGEITLLLYDDTPMHRDNFIELINKKFYDGILFHRVIPGFMIQAGDPNSKNAKSGDRLGSGNPGYTVPAEFRPQLYHKKGALAAARLGDQANPKKESSGSQFYIVTGKVWTNNELNQMESTNTHPKFTDEQRQIYTTIGGYPPLDYNYTVFGEVTEGVEIAEKIGLVKRDRSDRPLDDVKILSITILK